MTVTTTQADKRTRLLEAARLVMARRGVVNATTKEIASEAGVAEGTIYNHFADKTELCLAVVGARMAEMFATLPGQAGKRSVRATLIDVIEERLEVLADIMPLMGAVVGDPAMAQRFRQWKANDADARAPFEALTSYLTDEQRAGRLGTQTDATMLARLLLGTAFHHAFMALVLGEEALEVSGRKYVEGLVDATLRAAGKAKS